LNTTSAAAWALGRRQAPPKAAPKLYPPRNAPAIERYRREGWLADGEGVIVSLVGDTPIDGPHVFADPGRRYDWACMRGLHAIVVTAQGLDAGRCMADLYDIAPFGAPPTLVDFAAQLLATVVSANPLVLLPERRGSSSWSALFQ